MRQTKSEIMNGVTKEVTSSKKVANNTYAIRYGDGTMAYRLHNTDVVTHGTDFWELNSGGWRTNTTKDRINDWNPFKITQKNGQWFVQAGNKTYDFYDGIRFDIDGNLISKVKATNTAAIERKKKAINKYVNLLTEKNLPQPSNGDCWDCLWHTEDGKPMGDVMTSNHLESHMKEGYIPGALLVNAMREKGWRDEQIGVHYGMKIVDTFKRALRRYMQRHLIPEIASK